MKKGTPLIFRRILLLIALVAVPQLTLRAQTEASDNDTVAHTTDLYRIGPRDVLSIRVSAGRPVPELSIDAVEVDECGRIPVPSVQHEEQNEIQAAGRTRTELAETLRAFFKKYKRNPQVVVTIKEYNSQPVAINGAVTKPGQFQLRRAVRLLELVQFYAGGPTERASGRIQIARLPAFNMCEGAGDATGAIEFLVFNLRETLSASEQANPYLRPGDIITLPEAKEAYVVGNVLRPGPVLLKDDNITVSKAIAMAGGTMPDTKKGKVRIIRQEPGAMRKEIFVDLAAIDRQRAPDIALLPNDIVDVPTSGGRRLLRSLIGAIVPTVGQLPVQVIR
ncbi:MAG TPA: polysaccharide biosynthesis/export family protein [Pyrinomonadaceae bacterium]|jgi:polysaccharide export outer membrane protein